MNPELTSIPQHVPAELVRDVDIFNIQAYGPDVHAAWKNIQADSPPIVYTPRYGGHWMQKIVYR